VYFFDKDDNPTPMVHEYDRLTDAIYDHYGKE
jgi:hypothetical protein